MSASIRNELCCLKDRLKALESQPSGGIECGDLPPRLGYRLSSPPNGINYQGWHANGNGAPHGNISDIFTGPADATGLPGHVNGAPDVSGIDPDWNWSDTGLGVTPAPDQVYAWGWIVVDQPMILRDNNNNNGERGEVWIGQCCGGLSLVEETTVNTGADRSIFHSANSPVLQPGVHQIAVRMSDLSANGGFDLEFQPVGSATWTNFPAANSYAEKPVVECDVFPACDPLPAGWTECPPDLCSPVNPPATEAPEAREAAIEITCAALAALGNAGGIVPGQDYIVTDYNRGTVGAATIITQGVTANTVSWDVAVQTTFDDSAWMARWDPDTCRIVDMFDNLGNKIRSDNGDEIDVFPWGNALVSGNDFTDVDFNYTGGTVRDNTGSPTARIDASGNVSIQQNEVTSLSRINASDDARITRTELAARGTANLSGTAILDESRVGTYSTVTSDAVQIRNTRLDAASTITAAGGVGRIDNSSLDRGSIDVRNVADVNIDDLNLEALGRVLGSGAARVQILRSSASDSSYFQITAGNTLNANYANLDSISYLRVLNGTLTTTGANLSAGGRLDQNSTGANTANYLDIATGGQALFLNATDDNLIDYSEAKNSGLLRFRGSSTGGRIHRSTVESGRIDILDSNDVLAYYTQVDSIGYVQIQAASNGFQVQYSSFTGYGRMLVDQGSAGRVLGIHVASTGYVRLRNHASDLRYSDFDSYFYYYLTGNTAIKQGLNGSGRQSYTEPNPAATVTGPGVRNW